MPTTRQYEEFNQTYGEIGSIPFTVFEPFLNALDGAFCTPLDKAAGADCGTIELTRVLSISYAYSELQIPEKAARRFCAELMKLALKGHSILAASGNNGVAGHMPWLTGLSSNLTNGCANRDHIYSHDFNGTVFQPQFPASCPFVTAVGGTQLDYNDTIHDPERAFNGTPESILHKHFFSVTPSGGFSNFFSMLPHQRSAVDHYFDHYDPGHKNYTYTDLSSIGTGGGRFALGGRAIPDLAANGAHLATFLYGKFFEGGQTGTSLATPIVASIITMINQERTNVGKGPVGWINPVIYKHPELFTDITKGSNPGCGTKGFEAVEGWDPVTGLGKSMSDPF